MSMETVSWICVLGAAPCVVFGFVKYHGMTAEQFIWAWIKIGNPDAEKTGVPVRKSLF